MGHRKHNRLLFVARAVLFLFVSYYSNISLFQHCHIINGVTIVHSHLHGDSHNSNKSGNHTSNELTLIAHYAQFDSLEGVSNLFDFSPHRLLFTLWCGEPALGYVLPSHPYFSLRAPPALPC